MADSKKQGSQFRAIPDFEREICARFASARRFVKITQAEAAARLGLSRSQVANVEAGRVPLKFWPGMKFCSELNISQLWLATGELPKTPFLTVDRAVYRFRHVENAAFSQICLGQLAPMLRARKRLISAIQDRESASDFLADTYQQAFDKLLKLVLLEVPAKDRLDFIEVLVATVRRFKLSRGGRIETPENKRQGGLDMFSEVCETVPMRRPIQSLEALIQALREKTETRGAKAELARNWNISRQAVDQWLSGASRPSAEMTVKLLNWVQQREPKQNTPSSAINTARGESTRKRKSRETNPSSSLKTK